jgi:hypothetical protein
LPTLLKGEYALNAESKPLTIGGEIITAVIALYPSYEAIFLSSIALLGFVPAHFLFFFFYFSQTVTMSSIEKLRAYHAQLAEALKRLMVRRPLERNNAKMGRIIDELRRSGALLHYLKELLTATSENPDAGHLSND